MFGNILGVIGLGLSVVSAVGGFLAAKDRSKALDNLADQRNRAAELETKKNAVRERREKFKLVRDARIKRARAVSNATVQGASGSVRGGFGSIISQTSSGLQYINQLTSLTGQQNIFNNNAAAFGRQATQASEKAGIFSAVGSVGGTIFNNRADISDFLS